MIQKYTFIRFFSLCVFLLCSQAAASEHNLTRPTEEERQAALAQAQEPRVVVTKPTVDHDTTHFDDIPQIANRKEILAVLGVAIVLFVTIQTYRDNEPTGQTSYY